MSEVDEAVSDTAETVECLRQMLDEVRQILEAVKAPRSVTANMVWPEQEAPRVESAIERDRVVAEHVSEQTAIMLRTAANGEKNLKLQEQLVEAVRALKPVEPEDNFGTREELKFQAQVQLAEIERLQGLRALVETAEAEVERLRAEVAAVRESLKRADQVNGQLRDELETERQRLAACGVAALGYFEDCVEEYKSASLSDVLKIRAELEWYEQREPKVRDDAAFCADRAVSDVHRWEAENPPPGAAT